MLRVLAMTAQGIVVALLIYDMVISLWGWPNPRRSLPGRRRRRFRVVIPAHNEATGIPGLLDDLSKQSHPQDLVRVCVVADRCVDDTAAVAAILAEVEERSDGPDGKGAALAWYLRLRPLDEGEVLVILDADNRVPPDLLARFDDELSAERPVVQAYLDATDPDASWVAKADALSYWAGNRMVQLARRNLGWSPDLGGTGTAIDGAVLAAVGGLSDSLTEDKDLAARIALAGYKVGWLHDVRVRDEKPRSVGVAVRQRARWVAGKRRVARRRVIPLLGAALRRRSLGLVDHAIRLVHPGRAFLALVAAVMAVVSSLVSSDWLLAWPWWVAVAGLSLALPPMFLARDGVPVRHIAHYPVLIPLAALWLPVRFLSRRGVGWYHTPHEPVPGSSEARD